ncbi:BolA/IbaG family iron-sulfur metabolism protein [Polyangium aurulentum]|uniref:BolA/IbaG family iron-sulfur metabolism protein n=1 Tax=Polyangium aurulentum TaxID=2567896 RepID=UPI0010ADB2BA|nr:BolA family protein [Polyangium aurulentum]UQA57890.1 BolA/IbaG family iron-sulfur metabolism protein [Polyangium aurulentum]
MSHHPTNFQGSVTEAIEQAITGKITDAKVEVRGAGGHYEISVVSAAFAGKSTLEKHRMVLGAIAHLMSGDLAPVHAVDSIRATTP